MQFQKGERQEAGAAEAAAAEVVAAASSAGGEAADEPALVSPPAPRINDPACRVPFDDDVGAIVVE